MSKEKGEVENPQTPDRRVLEEKWGKSVISAGYTVLPSVVLKYQQRLQLKPLEINLLMHLLSYWWQKDNLPRPGKKALALAVGVVPSTVRRCLQKLEKAGYVTRIARRTSRNGSQPNSYDLSGLIAVLEPLAAEEHEEIRVRRTRQLRRLAGKKPFQKSVEAIGKNAT